MSDLLDELSELIYAVDVDTYELLYMNRAGRKSFRAGQVEGRICYQLIAGLGEPCHDCPNALLREEEFYNWEKKNAVTGKTYLLKDKLLHRDGRRVKVEIAFDITEKERQKEELQSSLEMEKVLVNCVTALHMSSDMQAALHEILGQIGGCLKADNVFVAEKREESFAIIDEWLGADGQPFAQDCRRQAASCIVRYLESAAAGRICTALDLEEGTEGESENSRCIRELGVKRMAAAPMITDGSQNGYIVVINPAGNRQTNLDALFGPIEYFIESAIRRQRDQEMLKQLSYCDVMTGVYNRNAYMEAAKRLRRLAGRSIGVVYIDANGLKEINDTQGHESGDRFLKSIVHAIGNSMEGGHIFRIGGDEFVVFLLDCDRTAFERSAEALELSLLENGHRSASAGIGWSEDAALVQELIADAEKSMYIQKREYYEKESEKGKHRHKYC